nr:hypothetical protein [Pseudopedobacter sp.]
MIIILSFSCAYAQSSKSPALSYLSINVGTFFATQSKIESEETGNILDNYTSPGVKLSLNYSLEKSHLFYSGGLAARILPFGYQFLIKKKDRLDQSGITYDYQDRFSEYYFYILSLPFKIGYQTLENKAKQKFLFNTGIELNFTTEMSLSTGYLSSGNNPPLIDVETESYQKAYPTFSLEGGISKVQKNGNQLKFGLEYNISKTNIIDGHYTVNLKNSTTNGTYRDTGTYLGFNFAYVFKLKK